MNEEQLAEVLAEHVQLDSYEGVSCGCGSELMGSSLLSVRRAEWHRAHLASVILPLVAADARAKVLADLREFLPEWNYPAHVVSAICLELKNRSKVDE